MINFQAQKKELDTEYNRLQQQYFRLSSEHSTLNNQQKRNFQIFKEQKANEIASLDGNVACSLTGPVLLVFLMCWAGDPSGAALFLITHQSPSFDFFWLPLLAYEFAYNQCCKKINFAHISIIKNISLFIYGIVGIYIICDKVYSKVAFGLK